VTFVVFEGGEGSGKSTQAARLESWLTAQGRDVVSTFEPGDTKLGAQIRELLLHGDAQLDARAELLLMLADRAQHVTEVIRPALTRGAVVISDRYTPSTLAYQGQGRGLGVAAVEQMDAVATGGLVPDVVIVLDVPDDLAEARVVTVRDRLERAGDEFHARVRAAYRELAAERGWYVVDGSGAPADVELRVREAVAHLFS
jgi:dTMP kinase